jgi:hypothetical protein
MMGMVAVRHIETKEQAKEGSSKRLLERIATDLRPFSRGGEYHVDGGEH